ncbi:MAG: glycosyltransferase family 2 protein [Deltaproteobacteria bacterium]|jgi:GT2 family glycosyltransferase|nr:glycosyltransferase family 2 protein [Deltaproteobacteria bacterium]
MSETLLSIIIPVFNQWEITRDCLCSLRRHTPGENFEVIVADNASSDATAKALAPLGTELFGPRFRLLRFESNRNFGPACNAAAQSAGAPLLFFLNNDTLLTPEWLPPLLRVFQEENPPGAAGPLLLYPDQSVQHLGIAFSTRSPIHLYSGFKTDHPAVGRTRRLQAITGAAMMLPATVFQAAEGFFEGYRNGYEDMDLCLRLRRAGHKLRCVPAARVIHLESKSAGRFTHDNDNGILFNQRCLDYIYPDLHQHGVRDGFCAVINDLLGQSLLTPPERDAELRAAVAALDPAQRPAALLQGITDNPYWAWGYETLADMLETQGKHLEAAYLQARLTEFYPTRKAALKLLRMTNSHDPQEMRRYGEHLLADITAVQSDPELQKNLLQRHITLAEKFHDRLLLDLCKGKLADLEQNRAS